jgi:hypothetical protein
MPVCLTIVDEVGLRLTLGTGTRKPERVHGFNMSVSREPLPSGHRLSILCIIVSAVAIESANMVGYSARQAVQKVGIGLMTLERYLAAKQFPAPEIQRVGGVQVSLER